MAVIDGNMIASLSGTDLENQLKKVDAFKKEHYDVIDATGAVWIFSQYSCLFLHCLLKRKEQNENW